MGSGGSKKSAEAAAKGAEKAPEAAPAQKVDPAPAAPAVPAAPAEEGLYKPMDPPESFVVDGLKVAGGVVSDHPDVRDGKVLQVAKHPEESMMQYWLKVEYGSGQIAFVHTLMSCGWNSDKVIRGVGDAKFPPDPKNLPASTEDAPAGGMAPPPPGDDQPYKIMDPPEDFVVEGLAVNERLREDYPDVCDGKVLQVAKHPEETMMQYWLKVQYGEGKIAFVHTMMSCGWTYNNAMLDVGEAAFPPDSKSMPEGEGGEGDGEDAEPLYKLLDSPEDFVVKGLQSCGGALTGHDDVKQGKVLQVAKHPVEPRMNYWLKVEYEGKIALVHMLMSCGWTSDNLIEDVGDVAFPPDPNNLPVSKGGAVELPDLKPADYAQEFVDPSHQEAIATDPKLKSAFPEASVGDVKSIWRGPTGFWLEVVGEPERTRYGAHFLQDYDAPPPAEGEKYIINCAVRLAQDEEFPPEPRATRGKAVAFKTD